jgi:hypothetical protein
MTLRVALPSQVSEALYDAAREYRINVAELREPRFRDATTEWADVAEILERAAKDCRVACSDK